MRTIFHIDMDAFYASVEVLDNPALRGKPVIVGGRSPRSVVSAASYEARKFGVHSAMPMTQALRLCPEAEVISGHMSRYQDVSNRVMAIFATFSPTIEPLSLDEAYLEMSHWLAQGETAEATAGRLQATVLHEIGLTCSVGVATCKSVAKIASDLRKPFGLVVVPAGEEAAFLAPLPIGALRGVGAVTEERLKAWGIRTIGDLAGMDENVLRAAFGSAGPELLRMAQGIDNSPVVPEQEAKSMGRETTFATDVTDRDVLEATLLALAEDVARSLRRHGVCAAGVTLKLRDGAFVTRTRARMLTEPTDLANPLYETANALLAGCAPLKPTRLIGVTATHLTRDAERQLSLFDDGATDKQRKLAATLDDIRIRFGKDAVTRARLMKPKEADASADDPFA
jgi:DNA polymerase-4